MKLKVLIFGLIITLSCRNSNNQKEIPNFEEKELSFLHCREGYDKWNNWIKQPANILMTHETFKKIGYKNLISEELWTSDWNTYLDVSKTPENLIDSLEITFKNHKGSPKYFREFWERRINEGNEKIVYQVIKEIKQIMIDSLEVDRDDKLINDTLFNLLSFEYPQRELKTDEANDLLEYLIKIGLHVSAYNLISGENTKFEEVNWNRNIDDVVKLLNVSQNNNTIFPWYSDNSK